MRSPEIAHSRSPLAASIATAPGIAGWENLNGRCNLSIAVYATSKDVPMPGWSDPMEEPTRRIKGLGEIALRVADLDAMQRFYQEVVGSNT